MKILKFLLVLFLFFVATSSSAFAEDVPECDCPSGYICDARVVEICEMDAAPPCDPSDQDCLEVDPEEECFDETVTQCVPPECESDSDCAGVDGTVCVEYVYESCGADSICTEPAEGDGDVEECSSETAECEIATERYCVPPYLAPCEESADCGAGFNCAFNSGGNCVEVPASDGDSGDDEPVCDESEPVDDGPGYCTLDRQNCQADSECDHGFVCHQSDAPAVDCGGGTGVDSPDSGEGDEPGSGDGDDSDEPVDDCEEEPSEVEGFCAPEGFYAAPSVGGSGSDLDSLEAERPGSDEGELIDSSHVGDDTQSSGSSQSSCATVTGSAGAPVFLLLAMLAGMAAIRRRQ